MYTELNLEGKPEAFLLGVVTGFYPHENEVYFNPILREVITHFGISTVTPYGRIRELLYGDILASHRRQQMQRKLNEDSSRTE